MKQPLTTNEKAVYDYIVRMKKNGGISPSIRDIKNELDLKSNSGSDIAAVLELYNAH